MLGHSLYHCTNLLLLANCLYRSMGEATVKFAVMDSIDVTSLKALHNYPKYVINQAHSTEFGVRDIVSMSLSCVAIFESEYVARLPGRNTPIIALSVGDSIYAHSMILSGPSTMCTAEQPVLRRLLGSLGRSEMVFLTVPQFPRLRRLVWTVGT